MGQLERYGLYVLVVVIFLILGVALWGGDEPATPLDAPEVANLQRQEQSGVPQEVRNLFSADPLQRFSEAPPIQTDADRRGSETTAPVVVPQPVVTPQPGPDGPQGGNEVRRAPVPTPAPTPVDAQRTHVIVAGETLSSISERYYGTPNRYRELERANQGLDARRLKPGTTIVVPALAAEASGPQNGTTPVQAAPGERVHVVAKGDVLGSIAHRYYGDAREWRRIEQANQGVDAMRLQPGTVLRIPPLD